VTLCQKVAAEGAAQEEKKACALERLESRKHSEPDKNGGAKYSLRLSIK